MDPNPRPPAQPQCPAKPTAQAEEKQRHFAMPEDPIYTHARHGYHSITQSGSVDDPKDESFSVDDERTTSLNENVKNNVRTNVRTTVSSQSEQGTRPIDAVRAMRASGLDNVEGLLEYASPDAIISTCQWWDALLARGERVGTGLLAKRIRDGGVEPVDHPASPMDRAAAERKAKRDRFARVASRFPEGAIAESHRRLAQRCWPNDEEDCLGSMIVMDAQYPVIAARCDVCGFEVAYPLRELAVLPSEPAGVAAVPGPPPAAASGSFPQSFDASGHVTRYRQPDETEEDF